MSNFARTFAVWRLQADTVAGILADRHHNQHSKRLKKALNLLDEIWMEELGEPYVNELVRLIELTQAGTHMPAAPNSNDKAKGTVVPFRLEGDRP